MASNAVRSALAELQVRNPEQAELVRAAIDWLDANEGLDTISQYELQLFLWDTVPRKWMLPPEDTPRFFQDFREALAFVFARAGLERLAFLCRSEATRTVHDAYAHSGLAPI